MFYQYKAKLQEGIRCKGDSIRAAGLVLLLTSVLQSVVGKSQGISGLGGWRNLEEGWFLGACLSHPPALICHLHMVSSLSQLSQLHDTERPTLGHFSLYVCVVLDGTLASPAALKHFDSYCLL